MNRDIFDEEYDKVTSQQSDAFDSWSNYTPSQPPVQQRTRKPWQIIVLACAMIVCLVVGWVLGVIVTDEPVEDERQDLLNQVLNKLDYNFYQEISDEQWQLAVEQAGSMLMQYAGDQYSFLMSPQTYYDFMNNVSSYASVNSADELFGIGYRMEQSGMSITDVLVDSAAYGNLQEGDLVFKLSNIKEYIPVTTADGYLQLDTDGSLLVERYSDGSPKIVNSRYSDGVVLSGISSTDMSNYFMIVYSATFHILRDGQIVELSISRNKVGISYDEKNINPNKRYDFKYVEYYFGSNVNNISTTPQNGAATSTYDIRNLSKLPANVGYIRIKQFDKADEDSCDLEFEQALKLFKQNNLSYLVLDLKGNPGGYVHLAVNIIGMLIHPNNLSAQEKNSVEHSGSLLSPETEYLVTRLVDREKQSYEYVVESSYYNYFPQAELSNGKKRIIVWTDDGSASASELLLGALLDYKTAVQMGTNTYGKGIAQTVEELNIRGSYVDVDGKVQTDGYWAVYYTFASYYSPLGTNIHGVGYAPANTHKASQYGDLWTLAKYYWGV